MLYYVVGGGGRNRVGSEPQRLQMQPDNVRLEGRGGSAGQAELQGAGSEPVRRGPPATAARSGLCKICSGVAPCRSNACLFWSGCTWLILITSRP